MKRLAVLISNIGTGTNLQAIIDATHVGKINAQIVAVVSDTQQSPGLDRAKKHNLFQMLKSDLRDFFLPKVTPFRGKTGCFNNTSMWTFCQHTDFRIVVHE